MKKIRSILGVKNVFSFVAICLVLGLAACNANKEKGIENEMTESGLQKEEVSDACSQTDDSLQSEAFAVEGDYLYYNDPERAGALYAYHMQTGEEILVSGLRGEVYRARNGLFYLSGRMVYKIVASAAEPLCELPEDGEFIDFYRDKIVWVKRNNVEKGLYEYSLKQSVYLHNITTEAATLVTASASEMMYDISGTDDYIKNAVFTENGVFIAQQTGLYCLDYETRESRCIFEKDIAMLCGDKDDILFKGINPADEDKYSLYTFKSNNTDVMQKIDSTYEPNYAMIKDGTVYYDDDGVMLYDVSEGEYKTLSKDSVYSNQAYTAVDIYGDRVILRHGYGYYFVVLNKCSGNIEKLDGTAFFVK